MYLIIIEVYIPQYFTQESIESNISSSIRAALLLPEVCSKYLDDDIVVAVCCT